MRSAGPAHDRVVGGVGRRAGDREIGPRRDAHRRGRERVAGVAQCHEAGDDQPTAGRVAGEDDLVGGNTVVQQAVEHRDQVFDRCRVGVFGARR